jgi:F0F1-type ATP synthase assembly protein I
VPKSLKKNDLDLWKTTSLGLELAVALALGAYAGHLTDQWLETEPWMLVIGCGLGLAAGMVRIIRTVSGLQSREADDDRP